MSGSRTTRKVTIDSGRRISSSGEVIDQPAALKTKSVFDRLGTINSKHGVKKASKSSKYSDEESYNSDEGEHDKKKVVSFTVKKNSLMEESENKLKKDRKKLPKDDDSAKFKKKKKQKEENQPIALYSKPKKSTKEEMEEKETEQLMQKKKKKATSPDMQPTKKKRRVVEDETSEGDENEKKNKSKVKKKVIPAENPAGSDGEGKDKKKKKKLKEDAESVKKIKKQEDEGERKVKKKSKAKSSDDDVSEEEKTTTRKKLKRQRSASWSVSEGEEEEASTPAFLPKMKGKNRTNKPVKPRRSASESPNRGENFSSMESDVSFESDDEQRKKAKRGRNREDFMGDHKAHDNRPYRKNYDQRHQPFDARHHRDDFQHRKRNDSYTRDDGFNEHAEERRRMNQYDRVAMGHDRADGPGSWRPGSYDDRNRRMEEGRFDGRNNRGRMMNRFVNRDDRGMDYYDNRRDDGRMLNRGPDNDWNRQVNYDDDRYPNRMNYRGRGRGGRGRGNFRGGYYQQNEPGRYNQQRDYDYRSRNPSHERMPHDATDRFSKHRYRDDDDFRSRNEHREKEQKFELSPLRGPNLIGSIVKRRDLSSDSEEEEDKAKKRKTSDKKKKVSKEEVSGSDASDTEQKKKKQKSKVIKTVSTDERKTSSTDERKTSSTDERKTSSTDERKAGTTDDRKEEKTKKLSVDDKDTPKEKSGSEKKKEDNNTGEEEKKKEKKVTHKRVSAVKDMDGNTSSGRKTPDVKESTSGKNAEDRKKDRKDEKKSTGSKDKRERTEKVKSQEEHEKFTDRRKKTPDSKARSRTPDSRRTRSPVRDSPYKRGRSPERKGRHRDNKKDSYFKDSNDKRDRSFDKIKGSSSHSTSKNKSSTDGVEKVEDVYESISDEELDLFDENDEDYKLPKPASVMDVDWSMLSNMNKTKTTEGKVKTEEAADYLQKLLPGRVLTEIGYSPTLLSEKTFQHVQTLCLKATDIQPESLDVSEKTKLKTGMAATVKNVLKQRRAFDKLFTRELIGLRNDLALRRELRKPADKIGTNYSVFCSAPANPVDYEIFLSNVAIYEKKQVNDGDPLYVTAASKVGSVIACKS